MAFPNYREAFFGATDQPAYTAIRHEVGKAPYSIPGIGMDAPEPDTTPAFDISGPKPI